ncbi:thioesterase family protein [Nocardioides panacisoli]|uniref:Thioesterase family protein n=1 Tax=Nocardioides panacisoli TaxID=627624 RepID=A0ABP7I014_9ACTN
MGQDAPTTEFDRDVAVEPTGEGRYRTELSDRWRVGGGLNGGFQLALLGSAIRAELSAQPDPIAISAYYVSPAVAGDAEVTVDLRRRGRRTSTVAAELRQGDAVRMTALATYGDLRAFPDDVKLSDEPLRLPPREECVPGSLAPPEVKEMAPFIERFELLFHPDQVGWAGGRPSGGAELSGWFRLRDDREPDPIALLLAVDALPPVTFELGLPGWAPTVELSAHVRALPEPGWLRVRHRTRFVAGGMFEEDCEVWDAADRLVAQSRQLALLPQ